MSDTLPLVGKVALITGAMGFGIGTKISEVFCEAGAHVVLNGRDPGKTEEVLKLFATYSGTASVQIADVSDPTSVNGMVEEIVRTHGHLDILVSNAAGGTHRTPTQQLSVEAWAMDIGTILNGAFYCCRATIPSMIRRGGGRIIFMSSSAAFRGTWGRASSYVAAKAGLIGLTKALALELGGFNITVNAIAPSQVDTPRTRLGGRKDASSFARYTSECVPLGRVGTPDDVAKVALFLASESGAYVTGQTIRVDGGSSLASRSTMELHHRRNNE